MCRSSIERDLEIMLAAAGRVVIFLPKQERSRVRRMMLKAFNLLQEHDRQDLTQALNDLVDEVERAGKVLFLSLFVDLNTRRYSGLIKKFHGFILHPDQGLLTSGVEDLCQRAVDALENASPMARDPVETDLGGEAPFELVRGEDGFKPYRS